MNKRCLGIVDQMLAGCRGGRTSLMGESSCLAKHDYKRGRGHSELSVRQHRDQSSLHSVSLLRQAMATLAGHFHLTDILLGSVTLGLPSLEVCTAFVASPMFTSPLILVCMSLQLCLCLSCCLSASASSLSRPTHTPPCTQWACIEVRLQPRNGAQHYDIKYIILH